MEDIKITDISDEMLKKRLRQIKVQEILKKIEARRQFLCTCNEETILAELQRRQGEERKRKQEISKKLIMPIIFFTVWFLLYIIGILLDIL